jgi:NADPH:quinone reductase-like Zn-dependent oxidoreductase
LVENGTIRPVIDRVFPLQEVREALRYSESGRTTGKVVIKVA